MSLNIKAEEAHLLAKKLAEKTGESLTVAVTEALRERLARVDRRGLAERLMEIGRNASAAMSKEERNFDYDAFLYDEETGLPK